jgi:hypothetical protein
MVQGMVIDMNDAKLQTLDQLRAFLSGTVTVCFSLAPTSATIWSRELCAASATSTSSGAMRAWC